MPSLSDIIQQINNLPELEQTDRFLSMLERLGGNAEIAELETIADEGFIWPTGQLNQLLWLIVNFRVFTGIHGPTPGICTFVWRVSRGEVRMNNRSLARAIARGR
jgi:hypothetical protein